SSRRRHTRSDRDWSSDVCSSDLMVAAWRTGVRPVWRIATKSGFEITTTADHKVLTTAGWVKVADLVPGVHKLLIQSGEGNFSQRSEERRVGKECRSRWARDR